MAYTTIDDPTIYFNTVLYTGDLQDSDGTGHTQSITGVGFQPDWVWHKGRSGARTHMIVDSVRGVSSYNWLASNTNGAEVTTNTNGAISSIDSDGITVQNGNDSSSKSNNAGKNGETWVSWNWLAGGTAPAITYTVKVVSDSGNKYRFDDFGTSAVTLDLQEGGTYTFDQSDSSNAGHPLRFYTASDKSGGEYTTGVTTTGTAGSSGAKTVITVAASAPTLYYQCSNHANMGGQANTNSTFGSSNFSGSIQSTVSANTTAGFSIVSYTGTGSVATIGHGLGVAPTMIIVKARNYSAQAWPVDCRQVDGILYLNETGAKGSYGDSSPFPTTAPTSTVFSVGTPENTNANTYNYIAYCFAEKKGYSKFGSYTGNGNANGTFVYTGFRPAFVMIKNTSSGGTDWVMHDSARDPFNVIGERLIANGSNAGYTATYLDFLSNGFKWRTSDFGRNENGSNFIYMAFAERPFVNSNGIPTNAR